MSEEQSRQFAPPDIGRAFSLASQTVGGLLAFTGLLTASGFVIVNAYILRYTRLFNYMILPTQYLTAGLGFMVYTAIATVVTLVIALALRLAYRRFVNRESSKDHLPLPWAALVLFVLGLVNSFLMGSIELDSISWTFTANAIFLWLLRDLPTYVPRMSGPDWLGDVVKVAPSFLILFFFIIYAGAAYGQSVYILLPRMFGGGQPIPIQLTLRDSGALETLDLQLTNSAESQELCLLSQAQNALLLYHPESQRTFWIYTNIQGAAYYTSEFETDCSPPDNGGGFFLIIPDS